MGHHAERDGTGAKAAGCTGGSAVTAAVACDAMSRADTAVLRPEDLEAHRQALTGYCDRMLGSVFEADDAMQETMVCAW